MKDFIALLFFLLAIYGLLDLIITAILLRSPHLMRRLAYRLMERASRLEKRMA